MITDFTLFHVSYVNPVSMDLVYLGLMRKREAQEFIEVAELQGMATCVEISKEHLNNGKSDHSGRVARQHHA